MKNILNRLFNLNITESGLRVQINYLNITIYVQNIFRPKVNKSIILKHINLMHKNYDNTNKCKQQIYMINYSAFNK